MKNVNLDSLYSGFRRYIKEKGPVILKLEDLWTSESADTKTGESNVVYEFDHTAWTKKRSNPRGEMTLEFRQLCNGAATELRKLVKSNKMENFEIMAKNKEFEAFVLTALHSCEVDPDYQKPVTTGKRKGQHRLPRNMFLPLRWKKAKARALKDLPGKLAASKNPHNISSRVATVVRCETLFATFELRTQYKKCVEILDNGPSWDEVLTAVAASSTAEDDYLDGV